MTISMFTRVRCTFTLALALPVLAGACAGGPDDTGEGEGEGEGEAACPINADARALLVTAVDQLFVNAAFATLGTHGGDFVDVAYGANLVGVDGASVLQNASLVVPCTEPTTFVPTCENALRPEGQPAPSPFFTDHDRCFRLGCADADQVFVETYFVMQPNTLPEPRHTFTVALDAPAGATSTYTENPYTRWDADLTVPDVVGIRADIETKHLVTLADDTPIDLSHTGSANGRHVVAVPEDEVTVEVALAFAGIAPGGAAVEVRALPDGTLTGSITVGDEETATLAGTIDLGASLPFAWRAGCE